MDPLPRTLLVVLLAALGTAFGGCGKTIEIVRAPLISPVVVPAPETFQMNVSVKNYTSNTTSDHLWLRVYSEYWASATPPAGQPPCSHEDFLEVGVLAPGQSWGHADYAIDQGGRCTCVKDACTGHVWLSLHNVPQNGPHLDGPNTALHVNWVPSGDLAEMTISAF